MFANAVDGHFHLSDYTGVLSPRGWLPEHGKGGPAATEPPWLPLSDKKETTPMLPENSPPEQSRRRRVDTRTFLAVSTALAAWARLLVDLLRR